MVGAGVPGFCAFGRTTKYGMRVPSLDFAQNCSTLWVEAWKRAGSAFTFFTEPFAASATHSVVGSRKPWDCTKTCSCPDEVLVMPTEAFFGSSSRLWVQRPFAGV